MKKTPLIIWDMTVPFLLTFLANVRRKGAVIFTPTYSQLPTLMLMLLGGRRMVVTALVKTQSSE
jgi:hypothetical protein